MLRRRKNMSEIVFRNTDDIATFFASTVLEELKLRYPLTIYIDRQVREGTVLINNDNTNKLKFNEWSIS